MDIAGLDMTGLARLGGVHRSQVSRWLGQKAQPDAGKLRAFRAGLCSRYPDLKPLADELWQAAGYGEKAAPARPLTAAAKDALRRDLGDDAERVIRYAEQIASRRRDMPPQEESSQQERDLA